MEVLQKQSVPLTYEAYIGVIRIVWNRMSVPIILSALTTVAGFLSLVVSPLEPMRHMGIFTAVGVAISGFCTLVLLPALLLIAGPNKIRQRRGKGEILLSILRPLYNRVGRSRMVVLSLILVLIVIALYGIIVVRSLFRLMRERDPFIRLAGTGLAATFGIQAMINMGVAVRLLPAKGMTLPFVSYGGSSLIAGGIAVGMLLACTRVRPQGEIGDLLKGRAR